MERLKEIINKIPKKYLFIGVIGIVVLILTTLLIIYLTKDYKITAADIEGYKNYYSKSTKLSFDFPEDYKVKKDKTTFYISKEFKGKEAIKSYIKIEIIETDKTPKEYFDEAAKISKEEYGNSFTPITEMLATLIGDKYAITKEYNLFVDGELTVEKRYVFEFDSKIIVVKSIELNKNNEEIKEICKNVISSIK